MSTTLLSQTAFTTTHLIRLPPRPAPTAEANAASPPSSNRPGRPRLGVAKDYHVRDVDSAGTAARLAEDLRAALLRLRHPNLVTMRQISTHRPVDAARSDPASAGAGRFSVRVVSDFVDDAGDLHNLLHTRYRSRRFLSEAHIFCIFAQICLALKYLHDNYICHGMLHPRNVLLQGSSYRKEDGQPPLTVKLTFQQEFKRLRTLLYSVMLATSRLMLMEALQPRILLQALLRGSVKLAYLLQPTHV